MSLSLCPCGHKPAIYVTRKEVWIQCNHCGRRTEKRGCEIRSLYSALSDAEYEWNTQNTHKTAQKPF